MNYNISGLALTESRKAILFDVNCVRESLREQAEVLYEWTQ